MGLNDVRVLIPFKPDGTRERQQALEHVLRTYVPSGWRVSVADDGDPDGPWCKGRALARAFRADAEVYIVSDADCFVPEQAALLAAVEAVQARRDPSHPWAMPHGLVRRLSAAGTARLYDGGPWNGEVCRSPYRGFEGGGMVILTRAALLACPIDPRFLGWGNEDEAWGMALRTLYGPPWRGEHQLVHLWHPPAKPGHRKNYEPAAAELLARYRQASYAGAPAMRSLLAEMGGTPRDAAGH